MYESKKKSDELLKNEDIQQKRAKAIITFIVSLFVIVLLFSLFSGMTTPGRGGGTGGGDGTGHGTGIGSGSGSGEGSGHGAGKGAGSGDGLGDSNNDGLAQGDEGVSDAKKSGDGGVTVDANTLESNADEISTELPDDKGIEEKLELPAQDKWSPSAFRIGAKKGSGKRKPVPKAAGRGGGGGGGTEPMGTGDVSFRIYWTPASHDVDLHVLDPNGHHLWFSNKNCACAGQLDVDDTKQGGPENIFWPKDKAPEGEYIFYVLYYQGFGMKKVKIEVRRDGKLSKTYRCNLRKQGDTSKHYSLTHEKQK